MEAQHRTAFRSGIPQPTPIASPGRGWGSCHRPCWPGARWCGHRRRTNRRVSGSRRGPAGSRRRRAGSSSPAAKSAGLAWTRHHARHRTASGSRLPSRIDLDHQAARGQADGIAHSRASLPPSTGRLAPVMKAASSLARKAAAAAMSSGLSNIGLVDLLDPALHVWIVPQHRGVDGARQDGVSADLHRSPLDRTWCG